ncbi:uncharacterized protein LOC141853355 [Brevipalpus obovatus]|uniref:uncharacterized protein LOC141853355 n=1 Tax=Brevipalpus obovatus TaxID=246614 RepID=UPI003D9E5674
MPPDYSPMYQGDSKDDRSKIHYLYLNSKTYGQCKKSHARSTPINMEPWISEVRLQLTNQKIKEKDAYIKGHYIPARKPTVDGRHQLTGILPSENEKFFEQENALFLEGLTIKYQNKLCFPPSEVASHLPSFNIRVPPELKVPCSTKHNIYGGPSKPCRDSKYRTIDGSCNNVRYPFWGKSNVCHARLLPAAYDDGVSKPRKSSY